MRRERARAPAGEVARGPDARRAASLGPWLADAVDRLLPRACVACGRGVAAGATPVCAACWHRLPRVAPPRCARCGATRAGGPCPECAAWPDALATARAPCRMEGVAAVTVRALKYGGWTGLARPMAREMAEVLGPAPRGEPPLVVPVPLSRARLRERGFNQAAWLARRLARRSGRPCVELLERRDGGRRQARLGRRARSRNVAGLFRVRSATGEERPRPEAPVLLVDDVLTTGSTAAACAAALREAGSGPVHVITFARAVRPLVAP